MQNSPLPKDGDTAAAAAAWELLQGMLAVSLQKLIPRTYTHAISRNFQDNDPKYMHIQKSTVISVSASKRPLVGYADTTAGNVKNISLSLDGSVAKFPKAPLTAAPI